MWKIDRNRFVGLRITKSALVTIAIALMSYTEIRQANRLYTWSLRGFPSAKIQSVEWLKNESGSACQIWWSEADLIRQAWCSSHVYVREFVTQLGAQQWLLIV